MKNRNELAQRIHQLNIKWWRDIHTGQPIERNRFELEALIVTELAEALEGVRKNLMDDHLPHRKMVEVEMADAAIRIYDYCGGFGVKLEKERDQWTTTCITASTNHGEAIWMMMRATVMFPMDSVLDLIEQYCHHHNLDLEGAIEEKLAYNAQRADHKPENRAKEGGKKF